MMVKVSLDTREMTRDMMKRVFTQIHMIQIIQALKKKQNALLESPTGMCSTGK